MADTEAKLAEVNPTLAHRVRNLISFAATAGFVLQVVQGLRTFAEQDALFSQGRTRKGPKVTNARGGQSMHNFGLACDLAFVVDGQISWDDSLYPHIGKWAASAGLEWGGNWKHFTDLPHVQLPNLPEVKSIFAVYERGGISAVWSTFGGVPTSSQVPSTLPIAHPQIQYGARGPQVGILQNALNAHGFPVTVDNDFGRGTEKAVKDFQHANAIDADGICGAATWKALGL